MATTALERHRVGIEIPEQGPQGAKEVDAEDEVEAAQRETDAGDGVRRLVDGDWNVG